MANNHNRSAEPDKVAFYIRQLQTLRNKRSSQRTRDFFSVNLKPQNAEMLLVAGFLLDVVSTIDFVERYTEMEEPVRKRYAHITTELAALDEKYLNGQDFIVKLAQRIPVVSEYHRLASLPTTDKNVREKKALKSQIFGYGVESGSTILHLFRFVKNRIFHNDGAAETSPEHLALYQIETYFGGNGVFSDLLADTYAAMEKYATFNSGFYDEAFAKVAVYFRQQLAAVEPGWEASTSKTQSVVPRLSWLLVGGDEESRLARHAVMVSMFLQGVDQIVKCYFSSDSRCKEEAKRLKKKGIGFKVEIELQENIADKLYDAVTPSREDYYGGWIHAVFRQQSRRIDASNRAIFDCLDMSKCVNFNSVRSLIMTIAKAQRHLSARKQENSSELFLNEHNQVHFWTTTFPDLIDLLVVEMLKFKSFVVNDTAARGQLRMLGLFLDGDHNWLKASTCVDPSERCYLPDELRDVNPTTKQHNTRRMGIPRDYAIERLYKVPHSYYQEHKVGEILGALRRVLSEKHGISANFSKRIHHHSIRGRLAFIFFPGSYFGFKATLNKFFSNPIPREMLHNVSNADSNVSSSSWTNTSSSDDRSGAGSPVESFGGAVAQPALWRPNPNAPLFIPRRIPSK